MKTFGKFSVLLAILLLGPIGWCAFAQTNFTTVANIGHHTEPGVRVAVLGNYLYYTPIISALETLVYDISSPASPTLLATTYVPAKPMATAGNYAYLALGKFSVVDISNPTNFQFVATWEQEIGPSNNLGISATAWDVAVAGNRAYLADGGAGMYIFDITNPTNVVRLGHTNDLGDASSKGIATGIAVSGSYAFLANGLDGLRVYDVSDPFNPMNAARVTNAAYGIELSGNLAFVRDYDNVYIHDVTDPVHPVPLGTILGWAVTDTALSGNYLFVESAFQGVTGYDVSNPALPLKVSHTDDLSGSFPNGASWFAYEAYSLAVSGNHAYVGLRDFGVRIYSLGTPVSPTLQIIPTSTNTLVLSWPAPTSAFAVQQSSQLNPAQWANLPVTSITIESRNQLTISAPIQSAFYRLVAQ